MILFLYGSDTYRSRAHLKKIIEKFKHDRDPQGLNVVRLDCALPSYGFGEAKKEEQGGIWGEILAAPFLAERRLAVLENLLVSKHQDLMAEIGKKIKDNDFPDSTVLVFWEGVDTFKTKAVKTLFEVLNKQKYSQKFDELKGVRLSAWITEEMNARGGEIESAAVQYLAQNGGGDMWRLSALLDQLLAHHTPITLADVQLFLDEKVDDSIFNLVDAIVARQAKSVFQMIQEQYRNGKDAPYIFAMIVRQFRILITMRDLFEREDSPQSNILAARLGLHPFVVKKSLPLVRRYSLGELKQVYRQLLDLDLAFKTSRATLETLLDVFVGRVCCPTHDACLSASGGTHET